MQLTRSLGEVKAVNIENQSCNHPLDAIICLKMQPW